MGGLLGFIAVVIIPFLLGWRVRSRDRGLVILMIGPIVWFVVGLLILAYELVAIGGEDAGAGAYMIGLGPLVWAVLLIPALGAFGLGRLLRRRTSPPPEPSLLDRPATQMPMLCPGCGAMIPQNAAFCPACGTRRNLGDTSLDPLLIESSTSG